MWRHALLGMLVLTRAHAACQLTKVTELPLTQTRGALHTTIGLNGRPVDVIVATGSFASLISIDEAKRLGIKVAATTEQLEPLNGSVPIKYNAYPEDVTIGTFHAKNVSLMASDWRSVTSNAAGFIGMDFFAAFDVLFDLPSGRLVFYHSGEDCPRPVAPFTPVTADIHLVDNGGRTTPLIGIDVGGVAVNAELDTAAPGIGLSPALARRLHVVFPEHGRIYLASVRIGKINWTNVPARLGLDEPEMTLGSEFFLAFPVFLSNSTHHLVLGPVASPAYGGARR